MLIPSPGLSCEYPDTSQEDKAVINVHIGANGDVTSSRLAGPSRSARFSNAAIDMFGVKRIRFSPAMRDGMPVAADGQAVVTFRITHCEPYNTHPWCRFGNRDAYYTWLAQQAPLTTDEQDQIAEAVLIYAYTHDTYLSANKNFGLYLRVRGKDPSPEFLARVSAATGVDLKPGSAIPMERAPSGAVVLTGRNMQVGVGEFTITEPNIARGGAGGYCGALCAGGSDVIVEKRDGVWEVKSFTLTSVM
jgi:TonB family protein